MLWQIDEPPIDSFAFACISLLGLQFTPFVALLAARCPLLTVLDNKVGGREFQKPMARQEKCF